jgi:hypothetical protein
MEIADLEELPQPLMVEANHVERALKETFSTEIAHGYSNPEDYA